MPLLSKAFFIGSDQVDGIDKVLDIVPSISFLAIAGSAHKIFDSKALNFFDYVLIEKAVNLKELLVVGVTFRKHKQELLRVGPVK